MANENRVHNGKKGCRVIAVEEIKLLTAVSFKLNARLDLQYQEVIGG